MDPPPYFVYICLSVIPFSISTSLDNVTAVGQIREECYKTCFGGNVDSLDFGLNHNNKNGHFDGCKLFKHFCLKISIFVHFLASE